MKNMTALKRFIPKVFDEKKNAFEDCLNGAIDEGVQLGFKKMCPNINKDNFRFNRI